MASSDDATDPGRPAPVSPGRRGRAMTTVLVAMLLWVWLYNVFVKRHGVFEAFFRIVDTLSDDVVMGSVVTVGVGIAIVSVFTITKLYTQIISEASSFRTLELLATELFATGDVRDVAQRLMHFEEEPDPGEVHPHTIGGILGGLSFLYVMSWVYLVLFAEALFFVSWSAGVDLPITDDNLNLLPTLALAIPFSARVMAYLRYRYTQDYADFMPGALFVLLLVASLGYLFDSHDQKFFLLQVWERGAYLRAFARDGLLLAFIPVFSEALYWMLHMLPASDDTED